MKPIKNISKKLFGVERDSLDRPVNEVISQLNASRGGEWTYDLDQDCYEDILSERVCQPYEIKVR
ncbi:hypothetical protein [Endozoicomonas euniceicola]|uniref:Uncharacterized protein n=1 Tax=Endozoicomonas euniceicola TaxID=1234143 RepID=A0ABY6GPV7_9GAMM|nr:hypothetical protein [Endozoicomonas euniceicola]UYM14582.1 hypothetical protein NX720_17010 [Endozoicomonas euniceicola]